jgi:hypothetical protein
LIDKRHLAEINFEAGDHAMPQDPRDVELALQAARIAWEAYPYLEQRYGERGRRFTDSDSCWLFTLARAPNIAAVTKSLNWLRTVLSSRGIPTVILEAHLDAIAAQIAEQVQFNQFLSDREAERLALFDVESKSSRIDAYDERFLACTGLVIPSAAELLTSAWIDERAGISGAVAALRDWLVDPKRFSSDWIVTVHDLLAELDRAYPQAL